MFVTHVPEIGAENAYQTTGTINRHENRACPIRYHKLLPEKFGTILYTRSVKNRYTSFLVYQFLVSISGKCIMGITVEVN